MCIAIAGLLTAIIYPFLRVVINSVREEMSRKKAQEKVRTLRTENVPPPNPIRVRQTDLIGSMTPAERVQHQNAEQLLSQGKVLEAAALFEAIRFQRRAVDILEQAKLFDDAAAVLLRLKVPNRAAILYERNGKLEEAAKYFLEGGETGSAAKVYLKLVATDFHYAQLAADAFQRIGKTREALEALAILLNTEQIMNLCLNNDQLPFLVQYMRGRKVINDAFKALPAPSVSALCASVPQTPQGMSILASWAECSGAQPALLEILRQATRHPELARLFAHCLTEAARAELGKNLARINLPADHMANLEQGLSLTPQGQMQLAS